MLSAQNARLLSIQLAIFTPELRLRPGRVLAGLEERLPHLDAEPTLLPVFEEMPADVPRIILRNKPGSLELRVAAARTDVYWRRPTLAESVDESQIHAQVREIQSKFIDALPTVIGRVGMISRFSIASDMPPQEIADAFCKPELRRTIFNDPGGFEVHSLKKYMLGGRFSVNSWVRVKSGEIAEGEAHQSAVLVELDLNTLSEGLETERFNKEDVGMFNDLAAQDLHSLLRRYFPGEQ